jgi:SPOR domain
MTERTTEMPTLTEAELHRPALGADGEPCAVCGAALASDQRYCLNCGSRRADARVPFLEILGGARDVVVERPAMAVVEPGRRGGGVLAVLVAGAAMATLLGLGVLAGILLAGDDQPAAEPPVVNVTVPAGGTGATAGATPAPLEPVTFTSDWPAGQEGWTVQLQALPKGSSDAAAVQAAEDDAVAKGAADVGALDSDEFPSLDGGDYIVYSGVFDTRDQARDALADLRESFPDASTIEVSTTADTGGGGGGGGAEVQSTDELEQQEQRTPEEAQKEIRKAPSEVQSEGAAPKEDKKQPGGGSGATEIG